MEGISGKATVSQLISNSSGEDSSTPLHCYYIETSEGHQIFNPRYEPIQTIYTSNASPTTIYLCRDTLTHSQLIAKRMNKYKIFSTLQAASIRREIEIHSSLSHPNIVDFYSGGELDDEFVILMEYLPRHDYFVEKIEVVISTQNNDPFMMKPDGGIEKLRSFTYDILQGLDYIHSNGVIHLDMKPANLLLKTDVEANEYPLVKICDFGLSRKVQDNGGIQIERKCGTDKYVPPEVRDNAWITPAVDMWCFGLILHQLTVGFSPYALRWRPGEKVPFSDRYWKKYKETALMDLISSCLILDPRERITAADALRHPWVEDN